MARTHRWLVLLLGSFLASSSWAVIPENGWWWNSDESGRGFNIEIQNNLLFLSTFGYDNSGHPVWYVGGGAMTSDRDWTGTIYSTAGGQCYGCPYVAPQTVAVGAATLHFTSSQTAVLTVGSTSISVKRENFWLNESVPDAMMGQWSAVIGAAGDIFDAERIDYAFDYTSSGTVYAAGSRHGSTAAANAALVTYDYNHGEWLALLDSSAPYYRLFIFNTTGFNRVEGSFYIYAKGSSPTGSGTFYQAFRTASAAYIQTGNGPASSKREGPDGQAARDAQIYNALHQADEKAADPGVVEIARQLETAMRSLRQ